MRTLVLGGTLFIGRALVDALLADHHDVTVLNRGTQPLWDQRIGQLIADRTIPEQVRVAIGAVPPFDAVLDVSATEPRHLSGVLDAVPATTRYVHIGSAAVYELARARPPFRETDPSGGDGIWGRYAHDKAACEVILRRTYERLTVFRPPYVYGPRNTGGRELELWDRMLAGEPIGIPGEGRTRIQFCHTDALAAVALAAATGDLAPGTYNVGESRSYSFADYVGILGAVAGCEVRLEHVDPAVPAQQYFPFQDVDATLDVSALLATGTLPDIGLRDGLSATFEWYCADRGLS